MSSYEEWLVEREKLSREKQQSFMSNIAHKLGRPRLTEKPNHPFQGSPQFWHDFSWSSEEKIQYFTSNFTAAGGHVLKLNTMEEVKAFVVNLATDTSAKYVISQNQDVLEKMQLEKELPTIQHTVWGRNSNNNLIAMAAQADIGIVVADYATAYTGSITVLSSATKGRSVSLLPTILVVIVPVERLYTKLGEVLMQFDDMNKEDLPAGIHFISGPSRSADIENDLTIGVHGPGIVYALLVG